MLCLTLFKLLFFTGVVFTNNTILQLRNTNIAIAIVGLFFYILLFIYFNKKGYKVVRNTFLIYFLSTVALGVVGGIAQTGYISDGTGRLIRIVTCLEIIFYLSFVYSKTKESVWLVWYGALGATVVIVNAIFTWFKMADIQLIIAICNLGLSMLLIMHFIKEPVEDSTVFPDTVLDNDTGEWED